MNRIQIHRNWAKFKQTIINVSKENNAIDLSKEELIVNKLGEKLGQSKEEITRLISKDLMAVLTQVPFKI